MAIVETHDLTKVFNGRNAVDRLDVQVGNVVLSSAPKNKLGAGGEVVSRSLRKREVAGSSPARSTIKKEAGNASNRVHPY